MGSVSSSLALRKPDGEIDLDAVQERIALGVPVARIAGELGISRQWLYALLKRRKGSSNGTVTIAPTPEAKEAETRGSRSDRFFNRELSWLAFNERVLAEAEFPANPLLERLKFLAIFESNLDEFYMVRVSGLIEQAEADPNELSPDGLTPNEQLELIAEKAFALRRRASAIWLSKLRPELERAGILIRRPEELDDEQREFVEEYFASEVFPLCTPLAVMPTQRVPFISNRSLNLLVELRDEDGTERLARIKVPNVLPRFIRLNKRRYEFVLLEDLIESQLGKFFPGVAIGECHRFRVIRDADIEIRELEASDLVETARQTVRMRRFGDPVLLEVSDSMPARLVTSLRRSLELDEQDVIVTSGLLGLEALWELTRLDRPTLLFPAHKPYTSDSLSNAKEIFDTIDQGPVLLHHPFDAFLPVQEFVQSAAKDPSVIGIKQTLYRVGTESPVVEALMAAAEEGKQVAVMVELKARFDESNNLIWSRALERVGAHVTYGFRDRKVHCKLCLIVRRVGNTTRMYGHIGTGNYNPSTARLYTDLGYFTTDPAITQDMAELFNVLTGFSKQTSYRKLLVSPYGLREGIAERIRREIEICRRTGYGKLAFKMNALVDTKMIELLYEASRAGVQCDLLVRGICCLRPGVPGLSENIRVRSVVGRFLEHSRIYGFYNGGEREAWIGSADLMQRNLDRRVEVLVPVESRAIVDHLWDVVMDVYWRDNVKAWDLGPDGEYRRVTPRPGEEHVEAQRWLMKHSSTRMLIG